MPSAAEEIQRKFAGLILASGQTGKYPHFLIKKEGLSRIASFLKTEYEFNVLMDLTAVDYLRWEEKAARFEVIYNLYSSGRRERLILKAAVPETDPVIESITPLWPAADWYEREVWDMYGIRFDGHPDLRRLLLYEEFKGHPLRKDYPYYKRQPLVGPAN